MPVGLDGTYSGKKGKGPPPQSYPLAKYPLGVDFIWRGEVS